MLGYLASGLVLTTFATNDLRRLRLIAILSNFAFIAYGGLAWLPPVLGLHLLLLPLNVLRLAAISKFSGNPATAARRSFLAVAVSTRSQPAKLIVEGLRQW